MKFQFMRLAICFISLASCFLRGSRFRSAALLPE